MTQNGPKRPKTAKMAKMGPKPVQFGVVLDQVKSPQKNVAPRKSEYEFRAGDRDLSIKKKISQKGFRSKKFSRGQIFNLIG
jgi:hypothetical protein